MKMAKQTTVRLVDDLDGSDAAESIRFALDGKTYEIDLSVVNAERLREVMAEFVGAARAVKRRSGGQPGAVRSSNGSRAPRGEVAAKRAWLAANGWPEVAHKRGRFSLEQDAAWASREAASEGAATVAEPSPAEVVETSQAPRKSGGRKGKEGVGGLEEAPVDGGVTRTRVSKLSGHQAACLAKFVPGLVVDRGSSWALLNGNPDTAVAEIEQVRSNTRFENVGDKRALAFVVRKITSGEGVRLA